MRKIYTIGHSSHSAEQLRHLLQQHAVEVLVDTRSSPYSKFAPQFGRNSLRDLAIGAGLRYLFLGDVIGGRPQDQLQYDGRGRVLYSKVAEDPEFLSGIVRLEHGADRFRVALLCAEEDPAHCHRRLLVGKVLVERGAILLHIRGDGTVDNEAEIEKKSGKVLFNPQPALFGEMDQERWRSPAAVVHRAAPGRSFTPRTLSSQRK